MRPYILAIPMSLLLAPLACAQTQDYPRTDSESVSTVQVTAPPHGVLVTADQAEAIRGTYEMSNGWYLKVQPVAASHGMIAQIDKQPPMHLIALPGDKFATGDGKVAMAFSLGGFRDQMTMSYVPGSSAGASDAGRVGLASR